MSVETLTREVRDIINKPRRHYRLSQDARLWNQLCSSLDVIEDTQLAIDVYRKKVIGTSTEGLYLLVYGLFQALYLQQDAVNHLSCAVGCGRIDRKKDYPQLEEIRQVRNDSVGHPTNRGNGKSSHFISRITLEYERFDLLSYFEDKTHDFNTIETFRFIDVQKNDICSILKAIISRLREEEVVHKKQFEGENLEGNFPKTIHYYFEKIYESISNPVNYPASFGLMHIQLIEEALKKFEDALNKRGISLATYSTIENSYQQITRRFTRLKEYLSNQSQYEPGDVVDFWEAAKKEVDGLIECARDIDAEYSKM